MGKFPMVYVLTVPVSKHQYQTLTKSADMPSRLPNYSKDLFDDIPFQPAVITSRESTTVSSSLSSQGVQVLSEDSE